MGMAERVHLEHLSHHDMNDMTYSMSAGYGIDQPIELHADDYSMINYGAVVYSKTGLVFTYVKDYLGDSLFDVCMQNYYNDWHYRHPQPQDLRAALEKGSGKDLGWLFDDLIPTTAQLDFAIKKVKYEDNQTIVTVKNTGQLDAPVRVDGMYTGKIKSTQWAEPGSKKTKLTFEGTNYDGFVIDKNTNMPEVNRNNNSWHQKGVFHKCEPLKMEFLAGDNEPQFTNAWWSPIMGGNVYDKFMIGVIFHNQTIPKNKFEYTVAPLFSFGRKNISGFANFQYAWVPAKNFRMIAIGVNGKTFGNGVGAAPDTLTDPRGMYYAIQPYLDIKIGKPAARVFYKQRLRLNGNYVFESGTLYDNTTIGGSAIYTFNYKKRVHDFGAVLRADYYNVSMKELEFLISTKDLLNGMLELKYRLEYWKEKDEFVEIRVFFGKNLMYNGAQDLRYGFAIGGQTGTMDAFYENYMFGRNEINGLWSNQRIENQGGFKTLSGVGTTNQMLFTTNLFFDLPYVPMLGIFADYGMYEDNAGNMESVYDLGIGLRIADKFAIYFPVYESDLIKNSFATDVKYWNKIRFVLNMNGINPAEIIQSAF
jgi:hypothetical protein